MKSITRFLVGPTLAALVASTLAPTLALTATFGGKRAPGTTRRHRSRLAGAAGIEAS